MLKQKEIINYFDKRMKIVHYFRAECIRFLDDSKLKVYFF